MSNQESSPASGSPLAKASTKGSRKKSKGNSVVEKGVIVQQGDATPSEAPADNGAIGQASSIVMELRKMKEMKKQEEEAANKDTSDNKKKKKRETKKKKKLNDHITVPSIIDKALTYIEQNHTDIDLVCLSEELTVLQKKVLKLLRDALDCTSIPISHIPH